MCATGLVKRFSTALLAALSTEDSNPTALAQSLKLAPSSITRVVKGQRPASNDLAAACCRYYGNRPAIAAALLVAHLLDVAEDFGLELGNLTVAYGAKRDTLSTTPAIDTLLKTLGAEAVRTPAFLATLQDLGQLATDYQARMQERVVQFPDRSRGDLKVAESKGKWRQPPAGRSQAPTA
jgi:hypothetical protein